MINTSINWFGISYGNILKYVQKQSQIHMWPHGQ